MWVAGWICILSLSLLLSASSYSWFNIWLSMEILLIILIPLFIGTPQANEAAIKYFIIQSVSAGVILFSLVSSLPLNSLLVASVCLKLGLVPFYFWVPHIYSGLGFMSIGVVSTVAKVPSLMLIYQVPVAGAGIIFFVGVLISSILAIQTVSMKKILGWSSVNHTSWVFLLSASSYSWFNYYFIYSGMVFLMVYLLETTHKPSNYALSWMTTPQEALINTSYFMSLAGLPPLLGFSMKWMAVYSIMHSNLMLMTLMICILSLSLFFYTQVVVYSMVSWNTISTDRNFNKVILFGLLGHWFFLILGGFLL